MSLDLPLIFMLLMGLSVLIYVVLDGYDLGVGILMSRANPAQRDTMIAAIGPFWDANETWLVLGIGILLIAFPMAHGPILTALYLPVSLMLAGLILRGVAFDFRVKAGDQHRALWDRVFFLGSLLAALSQGFMLGHFITGFEQSYGGYLFAAFIAPCLAAGYMLLGACWLVIKTEGDLQRRAIKGARIALWLTAAGIGAVSLVTPAVSERIYDKWFSLPNLFMLLPVPLLSLFLLYCCHRSLTRLRASTSSREWVPFACAAGLFTCAFAGLGYSLFPYLIVDEMTIWDAAAANASLTFILWGVAITFPAILGYTAYAYRVFWGKASDLDYG